MHHKFIVTKNVKRFASAAENINHKLVGMEKMCLVAGEPGLGKSETAQWYHAKNNAVYIPVSNMMSPSWLLRTILKELGQEPPWKTEEVVNQLKKSLISRPRTIILDEADLLSKDVIEALRYLHDIARVPMIFIGEETAPEKFNRYSRLSDRFVEVVLFAKLDADDVKNIATEFSDVRFEADAIEKIVSESGGKFRRILTMIHKAERIAKINQMKTIPAEAIRW